MLLKASTDSKRGIAAAPVDGVANASRVRWRRLGIAAALCTLTTTLGALSTTHYGLLAIATVAGIGTLAAIGIWFGRDPIGLFIAIWIFEVIQAPLSASVGYASSAGATIRQSSDVLTVLILVLAMWRAFDRSLQLRLLRYALPGIVVMLFGLLSAVVSQASTDVAIQGMWLGLKFWTLLAVAVLLPWSTRDAERVYRALMVTGAVVAGLGLVDYVGHGVVARFLHTSSAETSIGSYRAGAVQSILAFPGEFSLFMSIMAAVACARYISNRQRSEIWLFLLFTLSVFLSLRLKGVLSVGAIILVVGLCKRRGGRSNFMPAVLLGLILAVLAFSLEGDVISRQVATYSSGDGTTARADLYRVGVAIADDHFPLGVGFGRYASDTSRKPYSTVYDEYGLGGVYGLDRAYPNFTDDTTWPSVMGETGYAGLLSYTIGLLVLIASLFSRFRRCARELQWLPLAGLCTIAVMIVDSLGDPTFFEWRAVTAAALIVGPALVATRVRSGILGDKLSGDAAPSPGLAGHRTSSGSPMTS
jgi:hypothetical protein